MGSWAAWRRDLVLAVLLGTLLGAIGPFGAYVSAGPGLRIACWIALCVIALAMYGLGLRWALHRGAIWRQPEWFVVPVAIGAVSLPFSAVVKLVATWAWAPDAGHVHPVDWYWQTLLLSLPISLVWIWAARSRRRPAMREAHPPGLQPQAQLQGPAQAWPRLDRDGLICLQMEDHYVRVHSSAGSRLILSTLKTAVDQLGAVEGQQVHRSWWVARQAVVRPVWLGRSLSLELANGLLAPVSRSSVSRLRAAGWLDPGGRTAPSARAP